MAWMVLVGVVLAIKCAALTNASNPSFNIEPIMNDQNLVPQITYNQLMELHDRVKLNKLGERLMEILLHPNQGVPLVYVGDYPNDVDEKSGEDHDYSNQYVDLENHANQDLNDVPTKRSRYYRKYPWKRQNSREVYDAENHYLCQPSREDVFRLLVALHEARQGNGRTVNFCNRKRPATAVFTNIRFLGRRK